MLDFLKPARVLHPGSLFRADLGGHWLPGLDFGAKDKDEMFAMLESLYDTGFRKLFATPLIHSRNPSTDEEGIRSVFDQVLPEITRRWPDLRVGLAAEYYVSWELSRRMQQRRLLTLPGDHLLLRLSDEKEPLDLAELFFLMKVRGYKPIVIAPETLPYYEGRLTRLQRFREKGVGYQCSLLSLQGHYGAEVRQRAERMLNLGFYGWMGSGAVKPEDLAGLKAMSLSFRVASRLENSAFNLLAEVD